MKPYENPEWLREKYLDEKLSVIEISKLVGCGETTIRKWLRRFGIKIRTISEARAVKRWGCPGESNPMYGSKRCGPENPNWKGGKETENHKFYNSDEWKVVKDFVWERDGRVCKRCGIDEFQATLVVHHIIPWSVEEKRLEADNLVLLCKECHGYVHSSSNNDNEFIDKAPLDLCG